MKGGMGWKVEEGRRKRGWKEGKMEEAEGNDMR